MIFSVTEIQSFMDCRRQWDYHSFNRQALQPIIDKPWFVAGIAVHKCLQNWKLAPTSDLNQITAQVVSQTIIQVTNTYRERIGTSPTTVELVPFLEALTVVAETMGKYQDYWETPLAPSTELVSAEQTITVPIPGSEHFLEGTLDALLKLRNNGHYLIMDHKTYSQHPNDDMRERSFQFLAYQWIVTQLDLGIVDGLAYDGIWLPRTKAREERTNAQLFHREIIKRTKQELEEFEYFLPSLVEDMVHPSHLYPRVPWNGCFGCSFINLCKAQSRGEPLPMDSFVMRDRTHAFAQ